MNCPECGQARIGNDPECWQCGHSYTGEPLRHVAEQAMQEDLGEGVEVVKPNMEWVYAKTLMKAGFAVFVIGLIGVGLVLAWYFDVPGKVASFFTIPSFSFGIPAMGGSPAILNEEDISNASMQEMEIHGPIIVPQGASTQHLTYGSQKVQLDVYNPGCGNCPAVILIHGSAGIDGDRAVRYEGFARDLMGEGILAINVHYMDSSRGKWEETIVHAITFASMIENVDEDRIGLVGYSLGGTLGLQVASKDGRVSLLATIAGYTPSGFSQDDALNLPHTLMISGSEDSAVNTLNKIKGWREEAGRPIKTRINEGIGHNRVPMEVFEENWKTIVEFFKYNFRKRGF